MSFDTIAILKENERLKAELAEAKETLEGTTETLEDEEAAHQDTLRLLTAAQVRIAELEGEKNGRISRDRDIILEAINEYDQWMLDDDYEFSVILHKIMKRMKDRATLAPAKEAKDG